LLLHLLQLLLLLLSPQLLLPCITFPFCWL
jgi:hypothetical protein